MKKTVTTIAAMAAAILITGCSGSESGSTYNTAAEPTPTLPPAASRTREGAVSRKIYQITPAKNQNFYVAGDPWGDRDIVIDWGDGSEVTEVRSVDEDIGFIVKHLYETNETVLLEIIGEGVGRLRFDIVSRWDDTNATVEGNLAAIDAEIAE